MDNASFTGSIEIVNNTTGAYITGVYVDPSGSMPSGVNQIAPPVAPGASTQVIDLDPGSYSVRVTWDTGPPDSFYTATVSSLTLFTIDAS